MAMTDPIADMLTRIRNANKMYHEEVEIPHSSVKEDIARILKDEGYIKDFEVSSEETKKRTLKLMLKYTKDRERVISGLKRISKPGLRIYCGKDEIPRVLGGLGCCIISTSKGVMSGSKSKDQNTGGEVLCYVW